MIIILVILQDVYVFFSKQVIFFYDFVLKGMEGFGLGNFNVSYLNIFKWKFFFNIFKIDKIIYYE